MAIEEEAKASEDKEYQSMMTRGIELFEARDYQGAIDLFESAQSRRPVNVYPPVLIADAKLAIELQAVEPTTEEYDNEELAMASEPKISPEEAKKNAEERVEKMYQQELAKVYSDMPPAPKEKPKAEVKEELVGLDQAVVIKNPVIEKADKTVEKTESKAMTVKASDKVDSRIVDESPKVKVENEAPAKAKESALEKQERLATEFPDGITEEQFEEGNRKVVRRVVVKDGMGNEYRMVTHAWGGTYFFKNGTSITERVWKEETEK